MLGVAESFKASKSSSTVAGVVMRRDLIIDGVVFGSVTIKGNDSTQNILSMVRSLKRSDVNCIMLDGLIISIFNIIEGEEINEKSGIPVIAITFRDSLGLEETIRRHFPNDSLKLEQYHKLGQREKMVLKTGKLVFVRYWGLNWREASSIINSFTLQGSIPEPIRIAKLVARAILRSNP